MSKKLGKELNRLSSIEKKLNKMVITAAGGKGKKKKVGAKKLGKKGKLGNGVNKMFETGEKLYHHSPAVQRLSGVAQCIAAQVAPFDITRGQASLMTNAKPSQKFMARGYGTVSLLDGQKMCGFTCSNVCNDVTRPSVVIATGTLTAVNGCVPFGTAAAGVTSRSIFTNTPYTELTLSTARAEYRLVSSGLRIKCTSNFMNRGGNFVYVVDTNETFTDSNDVSSTFLTLEDRMLATAKSVRVGMATQPAVEITLPHRDTQSTSSSSGDGWCDFATNGFADVGFVSALTGINQPTLSAGISQAFFSYQNGTGATQNFDFEIVEHWEIIFPGAEQLATPSVAHPQAYEVFRNVLHQAHNTHSNHPTASFKSVVKSISQMAHNKEVMRGISGIGMALAAL